MHASVPFVEPWWPSPGFGRWLRAAPGIGHGIQQGRIHYTQSSLEQDLAEPQGRVSTNMPELLIFHSTVPAKRSGMYEILTPESSCVGWIFWIFFNLLKVHLCTLHVMWTCPEPRALRSDVTHIRLLFCRCVHLKRRMSIMCLSNNCSLEADGLFWFHSWSFSSGQSGFGY